MMRLTISCFTDKSDKSQTFQIITTSNSERIKNRIYFLISISLSLGDTDNHPQPLCQGILAWKSLDSTIINQHRPQSIGGEERSLAFHLREKRDTKSGMRSGEVRKETRSHGISAKIYTGCTRDNRKPIIVMNQMPYNHLTLFYLNIFDIKKSYQYFSEYFKYNLIDIFINNVLITFLINAILWIYYDYFVTEFNLETRHSISNSDRPD